MKLRVLFDVAELGSYCQVGVRGVRRVVENLARGLVNAPTVDVQFAGISRFDAVAVESLVKGAGARSVRFSRTPPAVDYLGTFSLRAAESRLAKRLGPFPVDAALGKLGMMVAHSSRKISLADVERSQIYHSPFRPLPAPSSAKPLAWVLTVYDAIPILHPELVSPVSIHQVSNIIASIHPDAWITCISETVKNDICELTSLPRERAFVTHLAASPEVFYPAVGIEAGTTRKHYGISEWPYILSVGSIEKRKNVGHLIDSFELLLNESATSELRLVLVGASSGALDELQARIAGKPLLRRRVIFTGFVPNPDLAAIYSGATAFAFPSLAEGFGLPPLEAMQCGVPVVCSNASSLPEVVADAGILLDPTNKDAWAEAMMQVSSDSELRDRMRVRSLARAANFTWEKTIAQLLKAYESVVEHVA